MRKLLKRLAFLNFLILIALTAFFVPTIWGKPWAADHFYLRYLIRTLVKYPMLLTQTGVLRPMGFTFYEDDLGDFSVEADREWIKYQRSELETLRSYDRASMPEAEKLSYDVMEFWLTSGMAAVPEKFAFYEYNLNPMAGLHAALPEFMVATHPFDDDRYAGWYVDRVSKFGAAIDDLIEGAREREKLGLLPPTFILERIREDLVTFTSSAATQNDLYTHFRKKTETLKGLTKEDREELSQRLESAIDNDVYPAWKRLGTLIDELIPKTTNDAGVWRLPNGDELYAFRLLQMTTTKLTAEEIHRLGLEKVGELQAETKTLLEKEGYSVQNLGETLRALAQEPRFRRQRTKETEAATIAEFQRIIDDVEKGMPKLFDLRPPVGVEVQRTPSFREASAAFGYYKPPPIDFSRKGIFFANMRGLADEPTFGMRTLAYHEAIPGHHFQIAIALGQEEIPMVRRLLPFSAYAEGWALYAERLAAENGYQKDPFDRLGYLNAQLFRAVRLVVDTGIHHKRWTREQAVQYMLDNMGAGRKEVEAEVDRYVVWPGQATSYMVGQLKILKLRSKMREREGEAFDIKKFHNRILKHGALPLFLLERVVAGG